MACVRGFGRSINFLSKFKLGRPIFHCFYPLVLSQQRLIPVHATKSNNKSSDIKENHKRGKGLKNCIPSTPWALCHFQKGHWISANSFENINTAKSLKRADSNMLEDKKGFKRWNQVVIWIIHLYIYYYDHKSNLTNSQIFDRG